MDIKQDLVRHYRWLRQYGLNDSHSGNASVRDGDIIWVTPTGACADTLEAEALIACPIDGEMGKGASLDAALHLAIYRDNPETGAVIHSHGPYTVALTMDGENFRPQDFEGQYYFKMVPVIHIDYEDYFSQATEKIAAALRHYPVAVARGHGVYAHAATVNLAYKWSCSLELSAKTRFIANQAEQFKNQNPSNQ